MIRIYKSKIMDVYIFEQRILQHIQSIEYNIYHHWYIYTSMK